MTSARFNCPYCWSDIPSEASVCCHCTRDLVLFKPLALRLQALSGEVAQLSAMVDAQSRVIRDFASHNHETSAKSGGPAQASSPDPSEDSSLASTTRSWRSLLGMVILTICAIGLCHWVLLFIYDAPPLFLRVLTITMPALTGYGCARMSGYGGVTQFLAALIASALSVTLMLAITAHIDGVSLWPGNIRDWRETLEYAAAIGLSFFTGYLCHQLLLRWARQQRNKISLRVLLARDETGQFKITEISNQVQGLITATAPLFSASVALYSGLKAFAGN